MSKNNYPSITAFLIAASLTAFFCFGPIIQWTVLYSNFSSGNFYFYPLILKAFNYWGAEAPIINGLRFSLLALLLCYLTKFLLIKTRELPSLLIFLSAIALSVSLAVGTSFFKFSSLCAILLIGLALFSKRRGSSVILIAFALLANIVVTFALGIGLCLLNRYRHSGHIYVLRFFLIMIDASLLAGGLFLASTLLAR